MRKHQKNLTQSVLIWLALSSSLLLSGCAWFQKVKQEKPVEVVSKPVERAPLNLSVPPLESLRTFKWIVITPANAEQVWESLSKGDQNQVLFGITDEGYQDLSFTMSEIRNYILMQRQLLEKYKEYYEPKKIEEPKK